MKTEVNIHKGREVVYEIFRRLYYETPSKNTFDILKVLVNNKFETDDKFINKNIEELSKYCKKYDNGNDKEKDNITLNLLRNFTRLFCLTDSVPMSESYYLSKDKLVMQESMDEVLKKYNKANFQPFNPSNEPADHLSIELNFMSFLSMKTAETVKNNNIKEKEKLINIQKDFLNNHILRWACNIYKKIQNFEESKVVYTNISSLMISYLNSDAQYLNN